jgi:very-short-patch-repair endonuclease
LDYAERGAIALAAQDLGSVGDFESPFEEAVAAQLGRRGWDVVPQVGISGFRIDLGIRHPDRPGRYLAGVECDGAIYHNSATARDRDKVREQVLRGLGWNILRVWSTDWWFDSEGAAERLHTSLQDLLEENRARRATEEVVEATHWDMGHEVEGIDEIRDEETLEEADASSPAPPAVAETELVSAGASEEFGVGAAVAKPAQTCSASAGVTERRYQIADLSGFQTDPERFFELGYRDTLRAMIEAVIEVESPLRADVLAQRIARAHGWLRTGGRIRERIDQLLRGFDSTRESSGEFIWKKGAVSEIIPYRPPADAGARRSIADIPLAELASVVLENAELLDQDDPARDLARLLGVERLAAVSRARLQEAIERARKYLTANTSSHSS